MADKKPEPIVEARPPKPEIVEREINGKKVKWDDTHGGIPISLPEGFEPEVPKQKPNKVSLKPAVTTDPNGVQPV